VAARPALPAELEAAGLLGRGGAAFPVGRKWRTVAERRGGGAVVLPNGAEGEPISHKDRSLMSMRPHLVLDGAVLAADAVGAREIVLYVGTEHRSAKSAITRAVAERGAELAGRVRLVEAPVGYVSGEESAAVHFVNAGDARPTAVPPRPFERGIGGHPTLVQNVESLAHAALIARFGAGWYQSAGTGPTRGTALITVGGAAARPGVREIALGTSLGDVASNAGVDLRNVSAVLLGGYFGTWIPAHEAAGLALDPPALRANGRSFGCGAMAFLPGSACAVGATARIIAYMAAQSARQCGPCVFGLGAMSEAIGRLAASRPAGDDVARLERWAGMIRGRGACRHPDGVVGLLLSALQVFPEEFARHGRGLPCRSGEAFRVEAA